MNLSVLNFSSCRMYPKKSAYPGQHCLPPAPHLGGLAVEMTFLSGVFAPLTSAEACEKSSLWLWKERLC